MKILIETYLALPEAGVEVRLAVGEAVGDRMDGEGIGDREGVGVGEGGGGVGTGVFVGVGG